MSTALIAVDVQTDFLPGGALGSDQASAVIEPLVKLADEVDYVIASRDWHPANHCSFSDEPTFEDMSWPVHCVQDTPGAEIEPHIAKVADEIVTKGDDETKDAYSAFQGFLDHSGVRLSEWLVAHGVDHIIVGGLVNEYCVKATAIDSVQEGFRTTLNVHASAGLGEETSKLALQDMAKMGVLISEHIPRGNRPPTREEAVTDVIDALGVEMQEADDYNAVENIVMWYPKMIRWVREYDEAHPDPFTVTFPDFSLAHVRTFEIPAAGERS